MAISNATPNIIKASDILDLENNSINTGKITCSSIECSGIISGTFLRENRVVTRIGYSYQLPSGSTCNLTESILNYDLVVIRPGGYSFTPYMFMPYLWRNLVYVSSEQSISFISPTISQTARYCFLSETEIKAISIAGDTTKLNLSVYGIRLF